MFVGNWKAYKTVSETESFFKELPNYSTAWNNEVIITPSYVNLDCAARGMPKNVTLGAQDVSQFGEGAHCGEVTAAMLKAVGVRYCIVGHVERRTMGEDNLTINKKLKNLMAAGIVPMLCVGDTQQEYEDNKTREVIEKQIMECLDGVHDFENIVVSYQPIWSIGTGFDASESLTGIIADFIRKTVRKMTGNPMSANFPILYGGGITAANARSYLEIPDIDGLMVGGTSLRPGTFSEIVNTKFNLTAKT
jgi:triosephosphate isomerase